jgi:hypothetical protein
LLLSSCGGPAAPTPTPLPPEPAPWGPEATPPAAIQVDRPEGSITLSRDEGKTIFLARVIGRELTSQNDFQGNPIGYITFQLEVKNNTRHDINRASGTIFFNNTQGERLDADQFSIEQPISAGEVITTLQQFLANEIVPSRKVLKEVPLKDIRLEIHPFFVSYANGVGQEITYGK